MSKQNKIDMVWIVASGLFLIAHPFMREHLNIYVFYTLATVAVAQLSCGLMINPLIRKYKSKPHPKLWEFIHNVVAHPFMGFTGNSKWSEKFHHWTAEKAFPRPPVVARYNEVDVGSIAACPCGALKGIHLTGLQCSQCDGYVKST